MPRSLSSRLFFAMWGLALILIAAAVVGSLWLIDAFVRQDVRQTLEAGRVGVSRYLEMQRALLSRVAESSAAIPMLKATLEIERLDRETASVAAEMVREVADTAFCVLEGPTEKVLASTLRTTAPDPPIDVEEWLVAVDDYPYLIATAEVIAGDVIVGRLVLGRALDRAFAMDLRELTGSDAFLLFEDRLVAGCEAVDTEPDAAGIGALLAAGPEASDIVEVGGVPRIATAVPLPADVKVVLARSVHGLTALHRKLMGVVAVSGLLGGLFALAIAHLVARRIARPIRALTEASASFARGNTEAKVVPSGSLETQALGAAFNEMVRDLDTARSNLVKAERLAAIGQLTVTMNHEMNNPLQGLLSTVEMALEIHRENPGSPDLQESLEAIRESGQQLRDAVRQITSLTDASAATYVGDVSMIDLRHPPS